MTDLETRAEREIEMAVQAIWSGTISFSLVAIPVSLVRAIEPGHVSFHLLHSKDYSPLAIKMICPKEQTTVPADEIVRGYEIVPDKYIMMTDEELESVSPERSRTIEIVEFIDMREVDPVYYDRTYYLVPSKGGEKAYRLLVEVLRRTNRAGLAKFVLTEREYLVAVMSREGALALTTLHYSDEILSGENFLPKKEKITAREQKLIRERVKQMIRDFEPGKYADERRKRIMDILETKVRKKSLVEAPHVEEEEGEGPADLLAMLKESMRKVKEKQ